MFRLLEQLISLEHKNGRLDLHIQNIFNQIKPRNVTRLDRRDKYHKAFITLVLGRLA